MRFLKNDSEAVVNKSERALFLLPISYEYVDTALKRVTSTPVLDLTVLAHPKLFLIKLSPKYCMR